MNEKLLVWKLSRFVTALKYLTNFFKKLETGQCFPSTHFPPKPETFLLNPAVGFIWMKSGIETKIIHKVRAYFETSNYEAKSQFHEQKKRFL